VLITVALQFGNILKWFSLYHDLHRSREVTLILGWGFTLTLCLAGVKERNLLEIFCSFLVNGFKTYSTAVVTDCQHVTQYHNVSYLA
jgi:hypothetical protein